MSSGTLFSRIPTLNNFQLSILIHANLTLSSLLRTPMPQLEVMLNDALDAMRKQRDEENQHEDTQERIRQDELPDSISRIQIQNIIKLVCKHLRVQVERKLGEKIADLTYEEREEIAFRTTLPALDALLGGIMNGILTELVGPAGVGKSQWSISMAIEKLAQSRMVRHELDQESETSHWSPNIDDDTPSETILYIDTEGIDIFPRMQQVASNRFADNANLRKSVLKHLNQIHILRFSTSNEMSLFFKEDLENYLLENHVTLIILDSIAYLIRKEFAGTTKLWERQNVLLEYATKLKELSSSLRIPVIITNHVVQGESTSFEFNKRKNVSNNVPQGGQQQHDDQSSTLKAALGNTWAHCVNTRLILQEPTSGCKQVIIDKSISSGREMIGYVITSGGVQQDPNWQRTMQAGAQLNQISARMDIFQGQEPPTKRRRLD